MAVNPNSKKRVLVALSGGVDSAVSAALLKDQGYSVEGAHMVCWNEGPYCTSDQDRSDATKVAAHLNIPFQVFDFRQEYKDQVINYFYSEYESGRTPNPDVACNREIKFGIFLNKALELGFDYIATGHYAQVQQTNRHPEPIRSEPHGRRLGSGSNKMPKQVRHDKVFQLLAGTDSEKDQSYFLYNLTQGQLRHTLFPIGHLRKTEVRQIAARLNLPNAAKKDSQGICFIGAVDVREFLSKKLKNRFGNIINPEGIVLGKHQGLAYYTIGQREGVGISQKIPHYVVSKDKKTNTIVAAPFNDESHFKTGLKAEKVSWVGQKPNINSKIKLRIRYRQPLFEAKIVNISPKTVKISFTKPQKSVTAGQSVVVYQNNLVLGGGTII